LAAGKSKAQVEHYFSILRGNNMSVKIRNAWNEWSDDYYFENVTASVLDWLKANPLWAFPGPVREMLTDAFPSFKDLKVLVPSSGDNCAAFAFHLLGARVTSGDISERQLANAKRIAEKNGWEIEFICADSMTLNGLRDDAFDLVYTSNGVHVWIDDLPALYGSIRRVLKPGGRYVMFDVQPFNRPFGDTTDDIQIIKPYEDTAVQCEPENYHWRVMDFINTMLSQRLKIERVEEFHTEAGSLLSLWWYKTPAEAEADGYKKLDWKRNPLAALPQWIAFSILHQ
jgi:SAM-dependent methyltransferase